MANAWTGTHNDNMGYTHFHILLSTGDTRIASSEEERDTIIGGFHATEHTEVERCERWECLYDNPQI